MLNVRILCVLLALLSILSCSDKELKKAKGITVVNFITENKKTGFDPLKHGFTCDSVQIEQVMKGKTLKEIIVSLGVTPFDTINMLSINVPGFEEENIMIC